MTASKDDNYTVEFYKCTAERHALLVVAFFNESLGLPSLLETGKIVPSSTESGENYEKYTVTKDGTFYLITRVSNTVLFIKADKAYKSEVEKIAKRIGY